MENTHVNQSHSHSISRDAAAVRDAIWLTMQNNHAPYCWPPNRVDHVLNTVACPETPFEELCQIASQMEPSERYSNPTITAADLAKAHQDNNRALIQPILRVIQNKVVRTMRIDPSSDLAAELREEIAPAFLFFASKFQPSRPLGDGFLTQGYEAYQVMMGMSATRTIRSHFKRHSDSSLDFLHENFNFEPSVEERSIGRQDLQVHLTSAIQTALSDNLVAWDLVRQMAYENESMREFAIRTGRSLKSLSESLSAQIKASLQSTLSLDYDGMHRRNGDLGQIATAIVRMLTREEFEALVPRAPILGRVSQLTRMEGEHQNQLPAHTHTGIK